MLARFFIARPIFAWVISIVIVLIGGVAAAVLPTAQYPDITPPTVQVTASYPGANAQVVADSVAAPIEQQVNGVERMMYMSSQCTNDGSYTLTITFSLGTDLNMAQVLVQNRVALAMPQLPQQVQIQGVSTMKQSPSILLAINLISPDGRYDDLYLSNYATIQITNELLRIDGVGNINYLGQREYSMRIWLDPDKLASRNLTAMDVVNAVQNQNIQVAAGTIGRQPVPDGQQFQYTMSTLGRLEDIEQFADIIVKTGQGDPSQGRPSSQVVRVRDVARVELGAQQYDQICRLNGQPSVALAVYQLPGSNALQVADLIKAKMEDLSTRFPDGLEYQIVYDTTPFINQSVHEVLKTLRDAVILVAIVVLFFLQDWKAMILPMIDVPVSLVGTFAVMAAMGFSLNNISLFGLVLAIGIVVDDAIVVLENIERFIALGYHPREATIKAMDEITGPILAITLVLCSVFLPAVFMPGITGQFFRQFALVIASSMIISAINAMTLTPARAVTIFKQEGGEHGHADREALPWWIFGIFGAALTWWLGHKFLAGQYGIPAADPNPELVPPPAWEGYAADVVLAVPGLLLGLLVGWFAIKPVNWFLARIFKGFNKVFDWITITYGWLVGRSLRIAVIVLLLYGGLLFLTGLGLDRTPKGFIPEQDQGYLLVNVMLPDSASVQRTREVMSLVERIALGDNENYRGPPPAKGQKKYPGIPGVANTLAVAGQSILLAANGSNWGSCFVILEPFDDRLSHEKYDAVIARKLQQLCATEIEDAIIGVFRAPPIQGLGSAGGFQMQVEQRGYVDMQELQAAADEVVRGANVDKRLGPTFTMFRAETPQLYIDIDRTKCESLMVEVQDVFDTLQTYMGGTFVNLFNRFGFTWQVNVLADQRFRTQAEYLKQLKVRNRLGQMVPLGTLVEIRDIGGPVFINRYNMYNSAAINGSPALGTSSGSALDIMGGIANEAGVAFDWTQLAFMQLQEGNAGLLVFGLGSTLVFLVLAAKYESWSLPLSVILVVPMCLLSAVAGVIMAHLAIDIFVQVGFVVLVGMAAKNAILIVEFAKTKQDEGQSRYDATVEACKLRLRPIVMTSFAFVLGVFPLVIGEGAGAEMRHSLGVAVFAGMIGVTLFGIFLTPVFYYVVMWFSRNKPAKTDETHTPAAGGPAHETDGHVGTKDAVVAT